MASVVDKKHARQYCDLNAKISSIKNKYSEQRQNKNAHKKLLLDQIRSAVQNMEIECIPINIIDEYGEEKTLYVRKQKQTKTMNMDEQHILDAISRITLEQLRETRRELLQKPKYKKSPPTILQIWVATIYQNIRNQICTSCEKIVLSNSKPMGFKKSKINQKTQRIIDHYLNQLKKPATAVYSINRELDILRQKQANECGDLEYKLKNCERSVDNVMKFASTDPDNPSKKIQPVMRSHSKNEQGQHVSVVHTLVSETKTFTKKIGLKKTEQKMFQVLEPIFDGVQSLQDSFYHLNQVQSCVPKMYKDLKREHTDKKIVHKVVQQTD